jgi:hypothetical protein
VVFQPRGNRLLIERGGGPPGSERGQERQADRAVQLMEQADRAGERGRQVGAQLVARGNPVRDQVLAGAYRRPQRGSRSRVRDQRPQPRPVGAQRVRQHIRVEPVILAAGGDIPRPQVLHLPRADHDHRQPGPQKRVDQHAVAPLDRDLGGPALAQPGDQPGDPGPVMRGGEPVPHLAGHVDHAHGVIGISPVDPGAYPAGWDIRQKPD